MPYVEDVVFWTARHAAPDPSNLEDGESPNFSIDAAPGELAELAGTAVATIRDHGSPSGEPRADLGGKLVHGRLEQLHLIRQISLGDRQCIVHHHGAAVANREGVCIQRVYENVGGSQELAASAGTRAARKARINVRASARQEQIIKAAAAASDKTVTDFVLGTVVAHAERVLADRRFFFADDEQWAAVDLLLTELVPSTPKLAALLSTPDFFAAKSQ